MIINDYAYKRRYRWIVHCFVFLFISSAVQADTVMLKDGTELKGLVVEQHNDRIVVSTFDGEKIVLRSDYLEIEFDDPAYSLYYLGKQMEEQKKYGVALSYYEKAHSLNPELRDAREAAIGIRSRFWSEFAAGPRGEMTKQQEIQTSFRSNSAMDEIADDGHRETMKLLWDNAGLSLKSEADWIVIQDTRIGGQARKKGLMRGDLISKVDGKSMRHLNQDALAMEFLEPRYSTLALTFQRIVRLATNDKKVSMKNLGLDLDQNYEGIVIKKIEEGSIAQQSGLEVDDLIISVNQQPTRYLSKRDVKKAIEENSTQLTIEIQRIIQMARK